MTNRGIQLHLSVDARDLEEKLKNLPAAAAKKVIRHALREGAKVVAAKAIELAPKVTGTLAQAIKVRAVKRSRKKRIGINAIIGEGWFKGKTFYAGFVEFGHRIGRRPRQPKRPKASRELRDRWAKMRAITSQLYRLETSEGRRRARKIQAQRKAEQAEVRRAIDDHMKKIAPPDGRKWWEGRHFMRRALETTGNSIIQRMMQMIRDGLEQLAAQPTAAVKSAAKAA